MVDNLVYEEVVLLQTILIDIILDQKRFNSEYDYETLNSLYEKVMNV